MHTTAIKHGVLASYIWPSLQTGSQLLQVLRLLILAVAGSLCIWASAKIQIPMWPVPVTAQTLVVLSIGVIYGWRLGSATIALYLIEGALGLPVFAGTPEKGIGLAYMVGPTGGYLLGFLVAALACGWLAEKGWDKGPLTTIAAMLIGNAIIYAFGIAWLGSVIGWDKPVLEFGLYPFLVGDVIKIMLATAAFPALWRLVKRIRKPE